MQDPNHERRKFLRLSVNFIVTFQVDRPPDVRMSVGGYDVDALMLDLGEGGMALTTDYEIPSGTSLFIYFTLINPYTNEERRINKMEIQGEVRHNVQLKDKQHRLGISFTRISEPNKQAISEFVRLENEYRKNTHPS